MYYQEARMEICVCSLACESVEDKKVMHCERNVVKICRTQRATACRAYAPHP